MLRSIRNFTCNMEGRTVELEYLRFGTRCEPHKHIPMKNTEPRNNITSEPWSLHIAKKAENCIIYRNNAGDALIKGMHTSMFSKLLWVVNLIIIELTYYPHINYFVVLQSENLLLKLSLTQFKYLIITGFMIVRLTSLLHAMLCKVTLLWVLFSSNLGTKSYY